MARQGYMNIRVDERTQQVFDEFVRIKGKTKSDALSEMIEIYMLCQDEELYWELEKKYLGVQVAKQELFQRSDTSRKNDFIFMKLGITYGKDNTELNEIQTLKAYAANMMENGLGYSWFSTQALHFGMAKKKIQYYNEIIQSNEEVKILFAMGDGVNDICYSAKVLEVASSRELISCPGEPESIPDEFSKEQKAKIWIKICDLEKEDELKASMLRVRSTGTNLKTVISNSQFHFGYVYLAEDNQ